MTRPADAVRSAVRSHLRAEPQAQNPLALVACSGGPDSLALAAGAIQAAGRMDWQVGAVVVDHRLQPDSDRVAGRAARACEDLGLDPVHLIQVDVPATGLGPEASARAARYDAFAAAAQQHHAHAVLLAHTLDDQAETVLLGLARGSGARSLSGMPARAPLPGSSAVLLRPLLGLRREVLRAACRAWDLQPWQDPHNADPSFTRSRVRHGLLPALEEALGPGVPQALARTAALLRDDDAALSALAEDALSEAVQRDPQAQGPLCSDIAAHPAAIRRRILRSLALEAGAPPSDLTAEHLYRLDDVIMGAGRTGPIALPGGVVARRRYGRLDLGAEHQRPPGQE